jgi:DNA-binding GntR family transcriptional regulator
VPVREALRELESSGLVVARKHAGVFVRQLAAPEIRDLYQLRALLDGFAGRQAAQRTPPEKLAFLCVLDDAIAAMQDAADQHDVQRYYGENLRFHWAIVEAAGNQSLTETYRGIVQKLHVSRLKNLAHDASMQDSITEHKDIASALRQGDPELCNKLLAEHVDDALSRLTSTTPLPACS